MALHSPAAQRNKGPLLEVLTQYLSKEKPMTALEIASGDGTHVGHFARHFPNITWQPSEVEETYFANIRAVVKEEGVDNVKDPIFLDISQPAQHLGEGNWDLLLNVNMTHITPFCCTEGLFLSAGQLLKEDGRLFMYGPFGENGLITPESNVSFDEMLRARDQEWGIRDLDDLREEGLKTGLILEALHDMPANNKTLVWKRNLEK